ncbi:MAG: protein kinase [Polyangiaceae bacterium]
MMERDTAAEPGGLEFAATYVEGAADPSARVGLEGRRLGGRYEILERIGVGGMGEVYRAYDRDLDEPVALKLLRPDIAQDPEMLERFRNEVKLARRVTHRGVARMFELGTSEDGHRFLTMELVEGESLARVLEREGSLSIPRALRIAVGILEGLEAAHAASVLHRDIKPDNVMVEPSGRVVVTDFGIARTTVSGNTDLAGTPAYMSPEQARGEPASTSSDVYAFGVTLFEMLTGHRPFPPEPPIQTLARRIREAPADPRTSRSDLSASLTGVLLRALAREPHERFASARDLRLALLAELPRNAPPPSARPAQARMDAADREPAARHRLPTLAVFPFASNAAPSYLGDALFDQVAIRLAGLSAVRVVARAFVEDDTPGALAALATELDADLFVSRDASSDGGEEAAQPAVRACIADAGSGEPRWTMTLPLSTRRLRDAADVVSQACALALDVDPRPEPHADDDPVTMDLELRARFHFQSPFVADLDRAIGLFELALERAPGRPSLLSGLAMARTRHAFFAGTFGGALEQAKALAEAAIAAQPELPDAHLALGHHALHRGSPEIAARHFRDALARAPQRAETHEWVGRMLLEVGYLADATKRLEAALRIDPRLRMVHWELARSHALEGDWPSSRRLSALARGVDQRVGRWAGHIRLAAWDPARAERLDEVSRAYKEAPPEEIFDRPFCDALLEALRSGFSGEPRRVLLERANDDAFESFRRRSFYCQVVAEVATEHGDLDAAVELLERAFGLGLFDRHWLERCPLLERLRPDPRMIAFRARLDARAERVADALFNA